MAAVQQEEAPAFVQLSKEDEAAVEKALRASFPEDEGLVKEVLATLSLDADKAKLYLSTARIHEGLISGPTLDDSKGKRHTFTGLQAKGEGVGRGVATPLPPPNAPRGPQSDTILPGPGANYDRLIHETHFYSFRRALIPPPLVHPGNQVGVITFYTNAHKKDATGRWVGRFSAASKLEPFEGPGDFN